jgi:MFS family permease
MKLSPLYPLRGLPGQGQLWSWISFDVANQSFTLIINTLLFSIFFQEVIVQDPLRDDLTWNLTYAASMLLVVLASPVAGAIADQRGWKKAALLGTGITCAALTCALAAIPTGAIGIAVLIYIPANFMFSIGENFLASFLPALAAREHFGRVSAFSWGCAYTAALLLLVLTAGGMKLLGLESSPSGGRSSSSPACGFSCSRCRRCSSCANSARRRSPRGPACGAPVSSDSAVPRARSGGSATSPRCSSPPCSTEPR